jgi:predicted DNA-binding transcriptional regulator YafY
MNRLDRLYALVEELRADPGRPRSAGSLARRFEVSSRTVERDISALQQAGVPIYAEVGRRGGYVLDRRHTLPPLNVDALELVALALVAAALEGTPLHRPARSAVAKVTAGMPEASVRAARGLAARIRLVGPLAAAAGGERPALPLLPLDEVVELEYADRFGDRSVRAVELAGYVVHGSHWYAVGWCRLRGGGRVFRLDRILGVRRTGERAPERDLAQLEDGLVPPMRPLELASA